MSADVDQLTRHRVGVGVHRFTHRLVAAADGGDGQHRDHGVEQPAAGPAPKLPTDADDHPDDERQQGGRPHPAEHLVHRRAERQQEQTAQSHEQGRSRRPALWLVGEADRQHGQHRPAHREPAQDGAGEGALLGRDERGGGEEEGGDEPGGQRAGHDPREVAAALGPVFASTLRVCRGRLSGGAVHDVPSLRSASSWLPRSPASLATSDRTMTALRAWRSRPSQEA